MRNRQRLDFDLAEDAQNPGPKDARAIEIHDLGEVLVDQPEARGVRNPGEDHDAAATRASSAKPRRAIRPVVHGEHGQRGSEGGARNGSSGSPRPGRRGAAAVALPDHRPGRLHGDDVTVSGLVGAGPGADVDHGVRRTQGLAMAAAMCGSGRRYVRYPRPISS